MALVALVATAAIAVPPQSAGASIPGKSAASRPRYVPREVLIRFEPGTTASEREDVRVRHGLVPIRPLPLPGLELNRSPAAASPPEVAARVSAEPSVRYAEPNFLWFAEAIPNDPEFPELWGLHNTGQTGGRADADIDAPEGWDADADSSNVVVGVIDTGIWIDHPDLQSHIWTNPGEVPGNGLDDDANGYIDDVHGWDFFNDDSSVFDPTQPDDHGTHVAGTIAAVADNGTNVTGVSEAQIMPLKFLGPIGGSTSDAILALDYAIDNGADLTNNSWGGGSASAALQNKIEDADLAGQLFVAAAGNDGVDTDVNAHYPSSYPTPNIISVAATTDTDGLPSFSNFGDVSVDLGAPGDDILSTVPRFAKAILAGPDTGAGVSSRTAYHTFGLEGVTDPADRSVVLSAALSWMGVGTADPILVVDDDLGESFQSSYTGALSGLGYTNVDLHTVQTNGGCNIRTGPDDSVMAGYEAVVWFTGNDFQCTLNTTDRSNLNTYLGGGAGRNLLLFGTDIGFDLTGNGTVTNTFFRDTLRADYVADYDDNFRPSGMAGTPYAGVPTVELNPGNPLVGGPVYGQTYSSAVQPRAGAVAGMRGAPTAWFSGTSMAAPHVTGVAAEVIAETPCLTNAQVKARILDTVDHVAALAGTTVTGGRLNLAGAMTSTETTEPTCLTATAKAGGQIDLSWLPPTVAPMLAGYNVYRGTTTRFTPSPADRLTPSPISGATFSDPGSNTVDGTAYFYVVRAVDTNATESGSTNEASTTADKTGPSGVGVGPLATFQRGLRFDVPWTGSDGSAITFGIEVRDAGPAGAWSDWRPWVSTAARSAEFEGLDGRTYCFRATGTDAAGNASTSEAACTAIPLDDPDLVHRGRWKQRSASGSYLDTYSLTVQRGARLILPRAEPAELTLYVTRCRRCGKLEVRLDGALLGRFGLRAPETRRGDEIHLATLDPSGSGTVVIKALTRGRRVAVEGLGIRRA